MILSELVDALRNYDEVTLIELLELTAEEIVDRCIDLIEERQDDLEEKIQEVSDRPD